MLSDIAFILEDHQQPALTSCAPVPAANNNSNNTVCRTHHTMEARGRAHKDKKPVEAVDLPQWNSRFRFSAQKQPGNDVDHGGMRKTPGLGQPRRVPVAAGAAAAGARAQPGGNKDAGHAANHRGCTKPTSTPLDANKTPTMSLFERFESLSLRATPQSQPPSAAAAVSHGRAPVVLATTAGSSSGSGSSTGTAGAAHGSGNNGTEDSAQSGLQQPRAARRSVAFGTPSVLTYTPAATTVAAAGDELDSPTAVGGTPLWSNAGHTPYSLPSTVNAAHMGDGYHGCIIREILGEEEDDGHASDADGYDSSGSSSHPGNAAGRGLRPRGLQLYTSIIHAVPEADAERTPLAAVALAAPKTPATAAAAAAGTASAQQTDEAAGAGRGGQSMRHAGSNEASATGVTAQSGSSSARTAHGRGQQQEEQEEGDSDVDGMDMATPAAAALHGKLSVGPSAAAGARAGAARGQHQLLGDSPSSSALSAGSSFTGFGATAGAAAAVASSGNCGSGATPSLLSMGRRASSSTSGSSGPGSSGRRSSLASMFAGAAVAGPAAVNGTLDDSQSAALGPRRLSAALAAFDPVHSPSSSAATPGNAAAGPAAPAAQARPFRGVEQGATGTNSSSAAAGAAAAAGGAASAAGGVSPMPDLLGMRLPPVTPKSLGKLKQPERVAMDKPHRTPGGRQELRQLLDDADAAAAAAAASSEGLVLGSCAVLSPVRAKKSVQQALDAGEQVLTPVRRSTRKATQRAAQAVGGLQPMLEATNFCYQPNDALQ